ncbi:uncharacterized protein [Macrobrachium rosenbergii]|uniref:uncharacterized protein n=1 Tax=Macrobrachium rosenbergii TaxID=79674 RepID=UPI0034D5897E
MLRAPPPATFKTAVYVTPAAFAAKLHHARKLANVPDTEVPAPRSRADVPALPMKQDAQVHPALAALLIRLFVSHYLPVEMKEENASLLLNQTIAQAFSTQMAVLETAALVAREVAMRRPSALLLEATASEKTVPTSAQEKSSNSVVMGTVSVAWILTGTVMGTATATATTTATVTVGNGEASGFSNLPSDRSG